MLQAHTACLATDRASSCKLCALHAVGAIKLALTVALGDALWPGQGLICRQPDSREAAEGGTRGLPQLAELRLAIDKNRLQPLQDCSARFPPHDNTNRWDSDVVLLGGAATPKCMPGIGRWCCQ